MQVRMRVSISGTRNGEPWPVVGQVIDLPGHEAVHMVNAGMAAVVVEPEPVETATAEVAAETRPAPRKTRSRKPSD
jgi:hypothetical protein